MTGLTDGSVYKNGSPVFSVRGSFIREESRGGYPLPEDLPGGDNG